MAYDNPMRKASGLRHVTEYLPMRHFTPKPTAVAPSMALQAPPQVQTGTGQVKTAGAYTAASIRVLTPEQASERFFYVAADDLVSKYPHAPRDFIERLLEACELASFPVQDAVRRYLDGDATVDVSPELIEIHKDLARHGRQV